MCFLQKTNRGRLWVNKNIGNYDALLFQSFKSCKGHCKNILLSAATRESALIEFKRKAEEAN
ncbi:hypothetical protein EMIT0324P_210006 [Pseudomonas chlororaphis]